MHVSLCLSQAVHDMETMSAASVGISDLSDEILLCILRHVPVCDLLMNVARVCNKFHTLCHDKTLLSNVNLSQDYLVNLLYKKEFFLIRIMDIEKCIFPPHRQIISCFGIH